MIGDPKKIAAFILGPSPADEMESEVGGLDSHLDGLAADLIKAVHEKNSLAVKIAMKAFYSACEASEEYSEGE